ncbi:hypothetical protein ACFQBY_00110 [Promicromonospora citrea]|uniref:hypothetical protein n=1 Tax=Promicromonospora citrea TaxID=43677 RepID=UPI0036217BDB
MAHHVAAVGVAREDDGALDGGEHVAQVLRVALEVAQRVGDGDDAVAASWSALIEPFQLEESA